MPVDPDITSFLLAKNYAFRTQNNGRSKGNDQPNKLVDRTYFYHAGHFKRPRLLIILMAHLSTHLVFDHQMIDLPWSLIYHAMISLKAPY